MKKIILTVAFIVSVAGAFAQTAPTLNPNGSSPSANIVSPPTTTGIVANGKLGDLKKDIKSDKKDLRADIKDIRVDIKDLRADIRQRRLDIKNDDKAAALVLTKDIRKDKKDISKDRRDIRSDKRDLRKDIRHAKKLARHLHHLSHSPNTTTHKGATPAK